MTPLILDLIAALILLAGALIGLKRGLFASVIGIVILAVSLIAASIFTELLTPYACELLDPLVEAHIAERVASNVDLSGAKGSAEEVTGILEHFGVDGATMDQLFKTAEDLIVSTGASATSAAVKSLAHSAISALLFALIFLLVDIVLNLLAGALDLVFDLPILAEINAVGGLALGLVEAGVFLLIALWLLRHLYVSFDPAMIDQTVLVRTLIGITRMRA